MIYNDAYSVFAGGRHPRLLGSKVLEGWPEVADLNRRVMEVGLRGETLSFRDEHLILYRPGRPPDVWVDLDYSPLLDESGQPAGVLAIVVETTERVRAEKALRDSEAQFRTFAAAMPHHVWAANAGWQARLVQSARWSSTPAQSPEALRGRSLGRGRASRRPRARGRGLAKGACRAAPCTRSSSACAASDGIYRWHLARAMPIRDDAGKVVRWIGTNTDIDDRIQAERALREREADLARVQQIGKVGGVEVFLTDGFRNRRSPEYLAIHGLPPEAAQESHEDWVRRIHPEDREKTERQFLDAVKGDVRDYSAEYRIVRPSDGQVRWIAVKAEIERDAQGRALRLVGAHIDITDRKARRGGRARERAALPPRLGKRPRHAVDGRRRRQMSLPQPHAARVLGRRAGGGGGLRLEHVPAPRRCAGTLPRVRRRPCASTHPSPWRPATAATTASTACAHGRSAALRCRRRVPRHDRRQRRHHRDAAGRAVAEGERGALPADRQQRTGADVGEPARRQARVRQPGLHGLPGPRLRRMPGL